MSMTSPINLLLVLVLFLPFQLYSTDAIATMAIDLGSEFIKVAIVKPGVPMEIALDGESSRKTPTIVTLRKDERLFGGAALNMAVKFPALAYQFIPTLIGKSTKDPDVQHFLTNFPYYKVTDDEKNGQLIFHHDDETTFTAEELLAMLLEKARETAEKHSGFPIKSTVITVPPYYTQASRRALIRAANLCDLSVLQLMTHNTAVALNYGVFRFKAFNATAQHYLFYDMGANSVTATLVEYRTIMHKESGMAEETPQLSILGVGYDTKLGTVPLALRLREYLATKFNELGKTPGKDVRSNARAMAKLFRESMRVMKVLSANQNTFAQVENVMDEVDLKVQLSRATFEEICEDLFARVAQPINQAVMMAQLPVAYVREVILMGGGTRIPKVQEVLMKTTDKAELGKGINSDEAAALGAVYQAAHLSPGFRVKRFLIKDANIFPIQVSFPKAASDSQKLVARTIFRLLNAFPQKKAITFNKHMEDFAFFVHHGEMDHLSDEESALVKKNLSTVQLKGVNAVFKKHLSEEPSVQTTTPSASEGEKQPSPLVDAKGIKAHFELNANGIFNVLSIEALFEKTKPAPAATDPPAVELSAEDKSTLEKLGSSFTNLFGSTPEEGAAKPEGDTEPKTPETSSPNASTPISSENKTEEANSAAQNKSTTPPAPKIELVSEVIDFVVTSHDAPIPSANFMKSSSAKIKRLREQDEAKRALEKSRNELEAYIFDMRDRILQEPYEKSSTEKERETLTTVLNKVSDWYDESGIDSLKADFDEKLTLLKSAIKEVEVRVLEMSQRPSAFAKLKDMLNSTRIVYESIQNFTGKDQIFTATEVTSLSKLMKDTQDWMDKKVEEANTMSPSAKPTVTVDDIHAKGNALQREIQYLLNKIDIWKANPPKTTTSKATDETEKKEEDKESDEKDAELPTKEKSSDQTSKPEDKPQSQEDKGKANQKTDDSSSTNKDPHTDL